MSNEVNVVLKRTGLRGRPRTRIYGHCRHCGKLLHNKQTKYCSKKCWKDYEKPRQARKVLNPRPNIEQVLYSLEKKELLRTKDIIIRDMR